MKSKVYIVLFIAIVAIIGLIKVNSNLRKETRRLSNNVFAISDTLIKERDNNGILQVKALELSMKNDELEQSKSALLSKLKKEAENSNVSQKKITGLTNVVSQLQLELSGVSKTDTVLKIDTLYREVEYLRFTDNKWYYVEYIEPLDTAISPTIKIKTNSDIILIRKWYRKGFWLWRWMNSKNYENIAKDLNPYNNIKEFSVVEIKK